MKLQKFKDSNNKKFVFIFVSVIFLFLLSGIYLYSSFAVFTEEKHFNVINGTVQDPGDIYFAYYVDGEITRSIPTEGSGYTLDTEKSNCTNGVSISFDDYNFAVITSYKNYNATDYTRTRCNLYFKKLDMRLTDYIKKLALYDNPNLTYDGTIDNNLRYIGSNPNNYVSVDGELWRIIGVMNNIDDGTGKKEARIKLIRAESIGNYSWDTSELSINGGYGVNEWSQADLMKLLNPGYENESIGGSLYWNSKSGNCYNDQNNTTTACDFASTGAKKILKTLIGDIVWNLGSNGNEMKYNMIKTVNFYELERSGNNGKICSSGNYCNDTVERTTTWIGKVGLMYPSDYGYATSGGNTTNRSSCLSLNLGYWDGNGVEDCGNNDWIHKDNSIWQITPAANISYPYNYGNGAFCIAETTAMGDQFTSLAFNVFPAVYLLSSVKIASGTGSKELPYILKI